MTNSDSAPINIAFLQITTFLRPTAQITSQGYPNSSFIITSTEKFLVTDYIKPSISVSLNFGTLLKSTQQSPLQGQTSKIASLLVIGNGR